MLSTKELTNDMFEIYDKDNSGGLDMMEVSVVLDDLNLTPKTKEEQETVKELFAETNFDGGDIDRTRFQMIYSRMDEQLSRVGYHARKVCGMEFGISEQEASEIINAFDDADKASSGVMQMVQAKMVLAKFRSIPHEQVAEALRGNLKDPHFVDFSEFLKLAVEFQPETRARLASQDLEEPEAFSRSRSMFKKQKPKLSPEELSLQWVTCRQVLRKMRLPKKYILSVQDEKLMGVLGEYLGAESEPTEDLKDWLETRFGIFSLEDFIDRAEKFGEQLENDAFATLSADKDGTFPDQNYPPRFSLPPGFSPLGGLA